MTSRPLLNLSGFQVRHLTRPKGGPSLASAYLRNEALPGGGAPQLPF